MVCAWLPPPLLELKLRFRESYSLFVRYVYARAPSEGTDNVKMQIRSIVYGTMAGD